MEPLAEVIAVDVKNVELTVTMASIIKFVSNKYRKRFQKLDVLFICAKWSVNEASVTHVFCSESKATATHVFCSESEAVATKCFT